MKHIFTPIDDEVIAQLAVGEMILLSGDIFAGRDAVLPKIVALIRSGVFSKTKINLQGAVIFHTAVSPAGIGPTSSNKYEIESSIPVLSKAGVKLHLGKGALDKRTIQEMNDYNSIYAVVPPVTALLNSMTLSQKVVAFPELGMEAFFQLGIRNFPAIVAAAHGKSIYDER